MRVIIESVEGEYRRYKHLAEQAMAQLPEAQLTAGDGPGGNSISTIVWHMAGNLRSRFTDFLTTDGEKPWRDREAEFAPRHVSRAELLEFWERGWTALWSALDGLSDEHLTQQVTIRGQRLSVVEALHRSLAHASYHVGQIVQRGKSLKGAEWSYLSIPPGGSVRYNENPTGERPPGRRP